MDELEFRRRLYADPNDKHEAILESVEDDESRRRFLKETRSLNEKIKSAIDVPVPEDLAAKLIWQSTFQEQTKIKRRSRVHIALAASVAFAFGMSFTLWSPAHNDLGYEALAHMDYAQVQEPITASLVSLEQVNTKLASLGAYLNEDIGDIFVANYCRLGSVSSLHLIVKTEQGPISVFFTPYNSDAALPERFENDSYQGSGFSAQRANIMVVGDKRSDIKAITQRVKTSLNRA